MSKKLPKENVKSDPQNNATPLTGLHAHVVDTAVAACFDVPDPTLDESLAHLSSTGQDDGKTVPSPEPSDLADMPENNLHPDTLPPENPGTLPDVERLELPHMPLDTGKEFADEFVQQHDWSLKSDQAMSRGHWDYMRINWRDAAVSWHLMITQLSLASGVAELDLQQYFLELGQHLTACGLGEVYHRDPAAIFLSLEGLLTLMGAAQALRRNLPVVTGVSSDAIFGAFTRWLGLYPPPNPPVERADGSYSTPLNDPGQRRRGVVEEPRAPKPKKVANPKSAPVASSTDRSASKVSRGRPRKDGSPAQSRGQMKLADIPPRPSVAKLAAVAAKADAKAKVKAEKEKEKAERERQKEITKLEKQLAAARSGKSKPKPPF